MTQKLENRKLILQQLLQKSQLFNEYLKKEQNLNSILNLSQHKKHKLVQFGKCEINLPEKAKPIQGYQNGKNMRFAGNKIMVLTKNKKEAMRIKEKYENLQKLKQTQVLNNKELESTAETQSERTNFSQFSKRLTHHSQQVQRLTSITPSPDNPSTPPITQPLNPESYEFLKDSSFRISPERRNNLSQLKSRTKDFIAKNRSSSAKVRPQFDFFLKCNSNDCGSKEYVGRDQGCRNVKGSQRSQRNQRNGSIKRYQQIGLESRLDAKISAQMSKRETDPSLEIAQHNESEFQYGHSLTTQIVQPVTHQCTSPHPIQQTSPTTRRSSSFSIKHANPSLTPSLLINKNYQQHLQQSKQHKIHQRRQLHKSYKRAFVPPPKVSAKSYVIYEVKQEGFEQSGKIIATINGKTAQEIASLTKIMTCVIVLEIVERFGLCLDGEKVEIGRFQTTITGTSAHIRVGDIYTLDQLLHGLMLPSGNDASLALGVWGGKVLLNNPNPQDPLQNLQVPNDPFKKYHKKDYIQRFVEEMNIKAQSLGMTKTRYANTHGLVNNQNKSAAIDIALLCEYAMANEKFAQIVGTRVFESVIKYKEQPAIESKSPSDSSNQTKHVLKQRQIKYQNTHYLLHKKPSEYLGIKTGVTTVAGPCLASYIFNKETKRRFIIVVLDCKSMMMRFKETQILKKWLYKQQNIPVNKVRKFKPRTLSMKEDASEVRSEIEETEGNSDGGEEAEGDQEYSEERCDD